MPQRSLVASYFTLSGAGLGVPARFVLEDRARAASEAGFTGIGLTIESYMACLQSGQRADELARIVADAGNGVVELEFLHGWAADDESMRAQARANEAIAYEMADVFGARHLNVADFSTPGALAPLDLVVERFAAVCDRSAEHGLLVALELLPWTAIGSLATALAIVDGADRANGGLLVDAWHFFQSGAQPNDLRAAAGRVVAVQLDDARPDDAPIAERALQRLPPGHGHLDLPGLLHALDGLGYDGPYSVEIFSTQHHALDLDDAARVAHDATVQVFELAG